MKYFLALFFLMNCFSLNAMNVLKHKIDDVSKQILAYYVQNAKDKKVIQKGIFIYIEEGPANITLKTSVDEYTEEPIAKLLRKHCADKNKDGRTTISKSITDVVHDSNSNYNLNSETVQCPTAKTVFTREEFEKLSKELLHSVIGDKHKRIKEMNRES